MNKTELAAIVAEETGTPKTTAAAVINAALDAIQTAVGAGDKVSITGFGAFEQVHKPAYVGRNPSTGDPIQVAESWAPKFRPGSEFKAAVNAGGRTVAAA